MEFQDVLTGAGWDEFGRMCGFAPFPYFQTSLEVTCDPEVTPEYAARCVRWLAEADETLIREICQYALYYLQDTLESTSVGDLLDEEIQHIQDPMDILRYMAFGSLAIDPPPDEESADIPVLNLGGGCDWQEDEGLQCLVKNGHVVYLGGWNDLDIWRSPSLGEEDYLCNYVYYPRREELRRKAAERLAQNPVRPLPHLEIPMSSPIRHFVEGCLTQYESCTVREASTKIENTLLFQFLQDYPALSRESGTFLCQCYRIERDQGPGDMAQFIEENCTWDLF